MARRQAKWARKARREKAAKAEPRKRARHAARGGIPGTTVVHVDREVYALLRKERQPADRGMNTPLRRLLGLQGGMVKAARPRRRKARPGTPEAQPEPVAAGAGQEA